MTAIKIEKVGKRYRLGEKKEERYDTFRNMLWNNTRHSWRRLTRAEPPKPPVEDFWALRDISFDVKQGQRVGIIGRNGAGKSTLLKLLSRITEPTEGRITLKGRVGSLLEVGTGFHPELTGRENIYLNGAVLGMGHREIRKKFDEIVDFSGIESFLDTPVKRYSSGMYVRLAFAVAAHLEPDVLIIDEVLAVGDAAFQKKCLGKMDEFGRTGRTLLFVSHSMGAITQMCDQCAVLQGGRMTYYGDVLKAPRMYMGDNATETGLSAHQFRGTLSENILFDKVGINGSFASPQILSPREAITFTVQGRCVGPVPPVRLTVSLHCDGARVATLQDLPLPQILEPGPFESQISIPAFILRPGEYALRVGGDNSQYNVPGVEWLYSTNELFNFTIYEEWSEQNDMGQTGLVNIPHTGKRLQKGGA